MTSTYTEYEPRTTPRRAWPVTVRLGMAGDAEAAARIIAAVHHATEQTWAEKLRRDAEEPGRDFIVAVASGDVVGYTRIARVDDADPAGWWLVGLIVSPAARRRGVGEALVQAAADEVGRRDRVLYSCYHRENRPSADLHARAGFVVVRDGDTRYPGFERGNDQVTVRLDLTA